MDHRLLFLIGASGAGKTTVAKKLEKTGTGVQVCYFDSIGVPSLEEMERDYGSGEEWQRVKTIEWIRNIKQDYLGEKDTILDAQTRPSFIQEGCKEAAVENYRIILFDCSDEVRRERLSGRGQPELATERMMEWGKYLREECQKEGCVVVDTSTLTIEQGMAALKEMVSNSEIQEVKGEKWNIR